MRAGAAFSFAGLLLAATACATIATGPQSRFAPHIKIVRVVPLNGPGSLGTPKIWDSMGLPDQPTMLTDSDPIVPSLYQPPVPTVPAAEDETSCRNAAVAAERRHRLPHGLLSAIAYTESSMIPTALRVDGRSLYPKTKTEAEEIADAALNRSLSVMAGCMQVNLRVHDPSGARWALDPLTSSNWAAEYLWELYDRLGSWASAISAYGGARSSNNYLYRVMENLQTVENDPSYVQLASYDPADGGFALAGCRYAAVPTYSDSGTSLGCRSASGWARNAAAEADAFPQFAKLVAAFRSGCWNLPEWLNGRAGACNTASSEKLRPEAVASDHGATVRLGGPEAGSSRPPVRRLAVVRPTEPRFAAQAPPQVRRISLPTKPALPAKGDKFGSGWPYLATAPNRSPTRRKPRFSRARRPRWRSEP